MPVYTITKLTNEPTAQVQAKDNTELASIKWTNVILKRGSPDNCKERMRAVCQVNALRRRCK